MKKVFIVLCIIIVICTFGVIVFLKKNKESDNNILFSAGTNNVIVVKNGVGYNYNFLITDMGKSNTDIYYDNKVKITSKTDIEGIDSKITFVYAGWNGQSLLIANKKLYSYNATYPSVKAKLVPTSTDFTNENVTSAYVSSSETNEPPTFYAISNGVLFSWGENDYGQIGVGDTMNHKKPIKVKPNDGFENKNVSFITANYGAAIVIENGVLYQFGQSTNKLGSQNIEMNRLPTQIGASGDWKNNNVTYASIGGDKTYAIEDDSVFEWGPGMYGEDESKYVFSPVKLPKWNNNSDIKKISTFNEQAVFIKDNKAWSLGAGILGYKIKGNRDDCSVEDNYKQCMNSLEYRNIYDYISVPRLIDSSNIFNNSDIKNISTGGGLVVLQKNDNLYYFGDYDIDNIALFSRQPIPFTMP